ncbi:unnamed protein product [Cuscuta epithymum]|uniref:Uncharacterized protein n=1 Tax=Cuscuta epithymum TaxID=186058 RepID=A0AAV0EA85_9ASTE|nr:unnamed protein product [Cuscuta epithymum]
MNSIASKKLAIEQVSVEAVTDMRISKMNLDFYPLMGIILIPLKLSSPFRVHYFKLILSILKIIVWIWLSTTLSKSLTNLLNSRISFMSL